MSTAGNKLQKSEWILEGLDCANCAMKIEHKVSKLEGVASCSVNFATKTLVMTSSADQETAAEQVQRSVTAIEPHVKVKPKRRRLPAASAGDNHGDRHHGHSHEDSHHEDSHHGHDHGGGQLQDHTGLADGRTHNHDHPHAHNHTPSHSHSHGAQEEDHHGHTHAVDGSGISRKLWRLGGGTAIAALAWFAPLNEAARLALFLAAYLLIGGDVVWQAVRNLVRGQLFDEFFLMSLATVGAFAIGEYPEGVAVMLFYQIGELFQGIAVNRSRRSITALMDIRPEYANLKVGPEVRRVAPDEVAAGDLIEVRPGERVPLDGTVVDGVSMVDTSALTGESVPRSVKQGSEVLGGFINKNGVITVRVAKTFGESAVAKILDLVENAAGNKARTENFITKFARAYTPVVVITAVLLAFVPPLLISGASFEDWIYRALIFLVISCPCALVVSIPLGFFGGIGAASRTGILVKGSNYLEALNDLEIVVFDKTGTLTRGEFKVTGIYPAEGTGREELLKLAAYAESYSSHPIAESVKAAYGADIPREAVRGYNEIAGHGVEAEIGGRHVLAGNARLMEQRGLAALPPQETGTVVYLAVDGVYAGCLVISDEIKPDAAQAVASLKAMGIRKTVMLTGDAASVAEAVGGRLGVDEVHAELLPQHKVEQIERLEQTRTKRGKIAFVGDGINDTPVLARADIGIAMGGLGSDAAIEAADIVIMTDEPSKIAEAIRVAKRTRRIVWQNIGFALGVKAVFLLLGAFGIATMWEAVFSDVGVTLLAVLNAIRVLRSPEAAAVSSQPAQ